MLFSLLLSDLAACLDPSRVAAVMMSIESAVLDPLPAAPAFKPHVSSSDESSSDDSADGGEEEGAGSASGAASRGNCFCCICGKSSTEAFSKPLAPLAQNHDGHPNPW